MSTFVHNDTAETCCAGLSAENMCTEILPGTIGCVMTLRDCATYLNGTPADDLQKYACELSILKNLTSLAGSLSKPVLTDLFTRVLDGSFVANRFKTTGVSGILSASQMTQALSNITSGVASFFTSRRSRFGDPTLQANVIAYIQANPADWSAYMTARCSQPGNSGLPECAGTGGGSSAIIIILIFFGLIIAAIMGVVLLSRSGQPAYPPPSYQPRYY